MQKLFLICSLLFLTASMAFAETMTMVTYYPAPFGAYDRLRLVPRATLTDTPCPEGLMYYDNQKTPHQFVFCNSAGAYVPFGDSVWIEDSANHSIYPIHTSTDPQLKVGIGTQVPAGRLDILRSPSASDNAIGGSSWYGNLKIFPDRTDDNPSLFPGEVTYDGGTDGIFAFTNTSDLGKTNFNIVNSGTSALTIKHWSPAEGPMASIGILQAEPDTNYRLDVNGGVKIKNSNIPLNITGLDDTPSTVTFMPGADDGTTPSQKPDIKIGVGTTSPAATLDVQGAVRVGTTTDGCTSANKGAIRYYNAKNILQYCNGTEWIKLMNGSPSMITDTIYCNRNGENGCGSSPYIYVSPCDKGVSCEKDLGDNAFCALGGIKMWDSEGDNGWEMCRVYYSSTDGTWKLKMLSDQDTIFCYVNCSK